jgi:MOSC domain-containing protein YiiM
MSSQQRLLSRYTKGLKPGTLTWIGLRPARKQNLIEVNEVLARETLGLEGDHRCEKTPGSARQVTLISEEYIQQIAHFLEVDNIPPNLLRRNLVVKNINLSALRHQKFSIGEAIFEATAICHPCTRMETALGKGALAAMLGHGGLCAKILRSGTIKVGDGVQLIEQDR